ncbi:hypothetical protein Dimus_011548 [Dionaea muscipula]
MYCLQGGWAGKTFALASHNESEGRKTRIRRSKEERKTMVETFIKKYQSLNKGNFPSLNLTHKEVGGSFYTVREIVREIIQENRILGPAKHHHLAAISAEPQNSLVHAVDETLLVSDLPSSTTRELPLKGNMQQLSICLGVEKDHFASGYYSQELDEMVSGEDQGNGSSIEYRHGSVSPVSQSNLFHLADDIVASGPPSNSNCQLSVNGDIQISMGVDLEHGQLVNGNQKGESDKAVSTVSSGSGSFEADGESKLIWKSSAILSDPTAEIDVETFPIPPVSSDGPLHHIRDLPGSLDGLQTKQTGSSNGLNISERLDSINDSSSLVNQGAGDEDGVPFLAGTPCRVDGQLVADLANKSLEVHNQATAKDGIVTQDGTDTIVSVPQADLSTKILQQRQDTAAKEPKGDGAYAKDLESTTSKKPVLDGSSKNDGGDDDDAPKGTSPTLDRINLESWGGEGASKRSSKSEEANPLLAFVKAFVTAFVKFWSE